MKIEVVKYNGYNDFKIKIDGVVFTNTTTRGNFISYGAMSQYIIKTKYNADLMYGGHSLLNTHVHVVYKGKIYDVNIGKNDHSPKNAKYFMNVMKSHIKHMDEEMEKIKEEPIYSFEV